MKDKNIYIKINNREYKNLVDLERDCSALDLLEVFYNDQLRLWLLAGDNKNQARNIESLHEKELNTRELAEHLKHILSLKNGSGSISPSSLDELSARAAALQEFRVKAPLTEIPENYLPIAKIEDFELINKNPQGKFILVNDIDLAKFEWEALLKKSCYYHHDGTFNFQMSSGFNGVFDGNNYTISNLSCRRKEDNSNSFIAFVGKNAIVRNLSIIGASIRGNNTSAVLAGINSGSIENCFTRGSLQSKGSYTGGICGHNYGDIHCCKSHTTMKGEYYVGGICGQNSGWIRACQTEANIRGQYSVGGLVGSNNYGIIQNSISNAKIKSKNSAGGLLGSNTGCISGTMTICELKGAIGMGGISGENKGLIENSMVEASILGLESVGGITGINDARAEIKNIVINNNMIRGANNVGDISGLDGVNDLGGIKLERSAGATGDSTKISGIIFLESEEQEPDTSFLPARYWNKSETIRLHISALLK